MSGVAPSLTALRASTKLIVSILAGMRPGRPLWASRRTKGDCFAKAYVSATGAPPEQDARLPRTDEDQGRAQGSGCAPQEGPPSPHARIVRAVCAFRATRASSAGANLTPSIAPGSAARAQTSRFFFAPTRCRTAASASASRKHSAARSCAIVSGGGFARWCAATGGRYRQDGTSLFIPRVRWPGRSSPR